MPRPLTIFLLVLLPGLAAAQGSIRGSVTDSAGQALASATVMLLRATDSGLVKAAVTDASGNYILSNLREGRYLIKISSSGYGEYRLPAFSLGIHEEMKMGKVMLSPIARQLSAVSVNGQRPLFEQKTDRMVINVQNSILAAGGTVLEVLGRAPGVVVDMQNGQLSLNGKQGVGIMINGIVNPMPPEAVVQYLSGLSADDIDRIEVITTPPSKLDAGGNGGFINIVLKKNNRYGTNGGFSVSLGYARSFVPGADVHFNHRSARVNVYGDFSFSSLPDRQLFTFYHQSDSVQKITSTHTTAVRNVDRVNPAARLGMDYQWGDKTVLGALVTGFDNRFINWSVNSTTYSGNQQPDTLMRIDNHEVNDWWNITANLNLQHTFNSKWMIQCNADYVHYVDNNPVGYLEDYFDGQQDYLYTHQLRSNKHTPINIWAGTLDLTWKPSHKVNVEAGLKTSYSMFVNEVEVDSLSSQQWHAEPDFTASYGLKELIPAGYVSADVDLTAKTKISTGLRYEFTNTRLRTASGINILNRKYGNLFPNVLISQQIGKEQSLSLSYNRRINRPGYFDLAPFVIFFDPTTFFSGNPALLPEISDKVAAVYSSNHLTVTAEYTRVKNAILNFFPRLDSLTGIETIASENIPSTRLMYLSATAPLQPAPWWSMTVSAEGKFERLHLVYGGVPYQLAVNSFAISSTQSVTLPMHFSLEVSGSYHSTSRLFAYICEPYWNLDAGIQKKFGNGSLKFSVDNMLNSNIARIHFEFPEQGQTAGGSLCFGYPIYRVTYSRTFGKSGVQENRKRNTGVEDEQQRARQN